ncbi:LOW QUALITY PROTEIN: hypothetical protein BC937DRAFT_89053 [Endogone sp. FLAS-F59071]|nr:LOW QUALITY PROTEIN: hypothetical protein BC937DRAFT_89053 [Endogone sp. FLAS-F59071]|eukprot:RUS18192.1 LOW QUALITY PROTEIN: hypothetical protein BC937DRAFT_89053 [Endogone sp. FLAS-F59071]
MLFPIIRTFQKRWYSSSSDIIAKAMVYSQYGKPSEVLSIHTHPLPALTPSTLHLRFLASPINPADINQIEGVYPLKPPFSTEHIQSNVPVAIGGNEGVAMVVAVGDEVSGIKVGDWVVMAESGFGACTLCFSVVEIEAFTTASKTSYFPFHPGTWRTHAVATLADVQVIPNEGLDFLQAATIAINPSTAYRMLKDFVNLQEGDFVIQNGANSSVGQYVIQIANAWGIKTINIVRKRQVNSLPRVLALSTGPLQYHLTAIGATHVITDEELGSLVNKKKVKEWTGGKPIMLGLNCVGGKGATEMAKYLSNDAYYVTYGAMSRQPLTLPASLLIFKNIYFSGFWMSHWGKTHSRDARAEMLYDIATMMRNGRIRGARLERVEWDTRVDDAEAFRSLKTAIDKGISSFGNGKQVLVMI